ncbi:phosphoglucosamine mutase [Candidatus Saccharibacteria bacterium]|nr:phosphoglucosamine mutase [Candidatus Saccharibacteria bacterium]
MLYFGTDGIRQTADKFTPEFLTKIIKGLADYAGDQIKVMLGGDTRESTEWIIQDLAAALETFGIEYGNVGVLPTPAINYCFYQMGFDFAIDVTASHNPYTDNGIKIFERGESSGQKLCPKGCEAIEQALASDYSCELVSTTLREDLHDEALNLYLDHLDQYIGDVDFSNLNIGLDCANGATSAINKTIFEKHGAKVTLINSDSSYNTKINHDCGSTHLEPLQALVQSNHLDCGIAFDGDGDRCLMLDKNGNVIDGDQIIAILAHHLNLDAIAVTVMANQGLLNWAKASSIRTEITAVGDSNVALAMREKDIKIGGEQSGHIILPGESTGDGILTSLMVLKTIAETGKSLRELAELYRKSPQVMVNAPASTEQKHTFETSDTVKALLDEYSSRLAPLSGRLLVRPSGTEPLIRITVWGDDESAIAALANELKDKLGEIL